MSGYRDNQRAPLPRDEEYARHVLRSELVSGETLLWANRPKQGLIIERNEHGFFHAVWTLFALIWVFSGLVTRVSLGVGLLGLPFVVIGLNGLFGKYLVDARERRDVVYGITNRRLLVATSKQLIASPPLRELRTHFVPLKDGLGHIRVVAPRLELRAVPNAAAVHRLLVETQSEPPESSPVSSESEAARGANPG